MIQAVSEENAPFDFVTQIFLNRWGVKTRKLRLVSLGSPPTTDANALSAALNKIFAPALTECTVSVGSKNIPFDYKDGKLELGDHALLSSYSAERSVAR